VGVRVRVRVRVLVRVRVRVRVGVRVRVRVGVWGCGGCVCGRHGLGARAVMVSHAPAHTAYARAHAPVCWPCS
jgi:hypothetical protein